MSTNIQIPLPSGPPIDLILVEGGEFWMGDDAGEYAREKPAHRVIVHDYYIGKYPVTQAVWKAVMAGKNPSYFKGDNRPVESVSWPDTQEFIEKLNQTTGQTFRLPTEAEWEYAARGGRYSQGYLYAGSDRLSQVGWYDENSDNETHEVGLLLGNELDIHDMSGNVYEWCGDWFDEDYYDKCKKHGVIANPHGPEEGVHRVLRGGSFFFVPLSCRVASRNRDEPDYRGNDVGFRLVLPLQ